MKKISVIVPVYNTEKYLRKCLDSLVNQTLKELEIIVVNDGSPDNSEKIIKEYEKKYPEKIKGYKKENGGLSDARNYGIKKATGEYITFFDSDDYVELDAYEAMYNKAKEHDFDIVACDLRYIYEDSGKTQVVGCNIDSDLLTKEQIKKAMLKIYPAACNKIYKKELFKNIEFKKGVWFEDVELMYRLLPSVNYIGVVKEPFINYLQREGAITSTFDERLYHQIYNWNGIIEYHKKNNTYEEYKSELEYCYVRYIYATFIKRALNYSSNEYNKAVKAAQENVKEHFPKYRRNKYFYTTGMKGYYLLFFNKILSKIMYKLKGRN